jgi:uncharacterized membrane protein YqjE
LCYDLNVTTKEEHDSRGERLTTGGGILGSIKMRVADAIGATRQRVDLFQADVEHRLFRILGMLIWGAIAIVSLSFGVALAVLTMIFGFHLSPKYAFGIPAIMFLVIGTVAAIMFRVRKASKYRPEKHAPR